MQKLDNRSTAGIDPAPTKTPTTGQTVAGANNSVLKRILSATKRMAFAAVANPLTPSLALLAVILGMLAVEVTR